MKTFKISSFIRGLVVAFAMSMFLPSVASATCTVSCEPYSKYEEYYKKLAAEQLALYNTTNNYCYYTAYLCYSKKATYFKQTFEHCEVKNSLAKASACKVNQTISDCKKRIADGYKKYADYYHDLYVKYGHACYETCSTHYMKKYDAFIKLHNDYLDKYSECSKNLDGKFCDIQKTIAEKKKAIADGYKKHADYYNDLYVKYGHLCYKHTSEHYMTKYNYFMDLYDNYMDKYNECQAAHVYGSVEGYIFLDKNKDGIKDANENDTKEGVEVTITDSNGETQTVTTDATGKYTFDKVTKGLVTIEVTEVGLNDVLLQFTTNNNPQTLNVNVGENNSAQIVGYHDLP